MIQANNIHKNYGELHVLKGVNISIESGEVVAIIGASGAGKTTLLQILGTLDNIDNGTLHINGKNLSTLKDKALSHFRNTAIGFVFQFHNLLPEFSALENICLPAFIAGTPKKDAERRALELLSLLKLSGRAEHKPNELSGGEQQRTAIARSMAPSPELLMLDEPFSALDRELKEELYTELNQIIKERQQTIMLVTHDLDEAKVLSDKQINLEKT